MKNRRYLMLLLSTWLLLPALQVRADRMYVGNYDYATKGFSQGGDMGYTYDAATNTHYLQNNGSGTVYLSDSAVSAALEAGGNVYIRFTEEIIINGDIYKSAGTDTVRLTIQAYHTVVMRSNDIKCTSGALDVILWSDYDEVWDNNTDGWGEPHYIFVYDGADIITNGGMIVLAGGRDDGTSGRPSGDGIPDGFGYNGYGNGGVKYSFLPTAADHYHDQIGGIQLGPRGNESTFGTAGINLISNGGKIDIRGRTGGDGGNGYNYMPGICSQAKVKIDAGSGQVEMLGTARRGHGVELTFGGTPNIAIRSSSDEVPAISIIGLCSARTTERGVWMSNDNYGDILIQSESTTGGGIYMEGRNTTSGGDYGITFGDGSSFDQHIKLLSAAGNIELYGQGDIDRVHFGAHMYIGADTSTVRDTIQGIAPISSSSANVILRAHNVAASKSGNEKTRINTTGGLHIDPVVTSENIYIATFFNEDLELEVSDLIIGDSSSLSAGQPTIYMNGSFSFPFPVTFYADYFYLGYSGVTMELTGADDDFLMYSQQFVQALQPYTFTTNGGNLHIIGDADGSGSHSGIYFWNGVTMTTNGGDLLLAGGDRAGTGYATGSGSVTYGDYFSSGQSPSSATGLALDGNVNLSTSGGDITLRGKSSNTTDQESNAWGLGSSIYSAKVIDSDTGMIYIEGVSQASGSADRCYGLSFYGAWDIRSASNRDTAIQLVGLSGYGDIEAGLYGFSSNVADALKIRATGAGGIYGHFQTRGGSGSEDLRLYHDSTQVLARSGNIVLEGSGGTDNGLYTTTSTGHKLYLGGLPGSGVDSSSSDITLRFDSYDINGAVVATSGELNFDQYASGTSNSIYTAGFLDPTLVEVDASRVTVGNVEDVSSDQPRIYIDSDITLDCPLTMATSYFVLTTSGVQVNLTGADDDLNLWAQDYFFANQGYRFTTNGGDVTFATDVDGSGSGRRELLFQRSLYITSNGGNITLGGGDTLASSYAVGGGEYTWPDIFSGQQPSNAPGITLDAIIELNSDGGDITLRGKSYPASANMVNGSGITASTNYAKRIDSGTGKVYIEGISESTGSVDRCYGLMLDGPFTITSASDADTAIHLIGIGGTGDRNAGLYTNVSGSSISDLRIHATGSGGILGQFTGKNGWQDMYLYHDSTYIIANSGAITLEGLGTSSSIGIGSDDDLFLGAVAGSVVPTSSSNVTLRFDDFDKTNDIYINTSGDFTFEPKPASTQFTNDPNSNDFTWSSSNFTNVRIGKAGVTNNLVINDALVASGDVALYGGTLTIGDTIAAGGEVNLNIGTRATQSAPVRASGLSVSGTGTVELFNPANNVDTFAAGGVGLTTVTYYDADSFTVGALSTLSGISASGQIDLHAQLGNLTIAENITTTSNANEAIKIQADTATAGNDGNGNIILVGNPSISAPNGYTLFFTGTKDNSTGLYDFVGGAPNSVNNADPSNYTTAFTAKGVTLTQGGQYAIYRQSAALPVEWLYFRAECDGLQSVLNWATAMEENNDYFEVQRSTDTREWQTIGHLQGAGTSLTEQHYTYTDLDPATGVRYYRIRQVDYDGTSAYSAMVTTQCKNDRADNQYALFPNPAHSIATLVVPSATGYVQVRNALGQLVHETRIQSTHTVLPVDQLQAGLYHVLIQSGDQVTTLPLMVD